MSYLIAKSLHIIAVICWFAVLFYLPRLFVYHTEVTDSEGLERFKTMERKLFYGIGLPSFICALLFGIIMLYLSPNWLHYPWMMAKLTLVTILALYFYRCRFHMIQFAYDRNKHSQKYFRLFNEVPVVILISVVFLVVLKPSF